MNTVLGLHDVLPLTCTRAGTCCHGKDVRINPWELACLANAAEVPARVLREQRLINATRLRFDGPAGPAGSTACTLYDPSAGCSLHAARPLACRLYPLGRERRGDQVKYLHEGRRFPCLSGCPEVAHLPRLSVADYLKGQATTTGEAVQDAYRTFVADVAEGAFVLLFDSGLARIPGQLHDTLTAWRSLQHHQARLDAIDDLWLDLTTAPLVAVPLDDGPAWVAAHQQLFQSEAQHHFASLSTPAALNAASQRMLAMALMLAESINANTAKLLTKWVKRAAC